MEHHLGCGIDIKHIAKQGRNTYMRMGSDHVEMQLDSKSKVVFYANGKMKCHVKGSNTFEALRKIRRKYARIDQKLGHPNIELGRLLRYKVSYHLFCNPIDLLAL